MSSTRSILITLYWVVTVLAFASALALLLTYTPTEASMGQIQKIFYLHLPVAMCTFFACFVTFIASIGYLAQRDTRWDDLASGSASIGVHLCTVVLLTGMIWARSAWGVWWTWSPRLTFSLVLWLLYVVYLMIRLSIESQQRRAVISAMYGIIAFLDVPMVYLSVRLMPDVHPTSIQLAWPMKLTLLAWFVPVIMLTVGLIVAKSALNAKLRLTSSRRNEAARPAGPAPAYSGGAR
jgi:heme exporter protein C